MGSRPSYIWRSIMDAREILKRGTRWRVGNGETIKVWKDKWVPNLPYAKIMSPVRLLSPMALEEENIIHAIWNYPAAQDVWHQCSTKLQKCHSPKPSIKNLITELEDSGGKEVIEEFAVVARRIWMRRNQFIFQQEFRSPNSVAKLAKEILYELNSTTLNESVQQLSIQNRPNWSPPPENTFKLNWDAAVDRIQCKIGIGLIIRDWNGRVVATSGKYRPLFPDPLLAEAMGAMEATCFGLQLGITRIILEGDSKIVISAINIRKEEVSATGMLIEDFKNQLNSYEEWSILHVRREGNQAAHKLARDALLHSNSSIDMGIIPHCIHDCC
ncbi:hypothetical protein F2P56_022864 [Juglans regia]|uniref:RNase H type-1 domain-containing protein n=2 Tax=Juglans regia TaxID=51240 RepID=A0A833TFQ5_JUGRE|nr:uncharacterized protein LOC108992720 [Juglans regia]KAF5458866.1 hypothetical protein F2P56_022864 [Juglans regia]